jgi:cytochrome c peroxidase
MQTRRLLVLTILVVIGLCATSCGAKRAASDVAGRDALKRFATLPETMASVDKAISEQMISLGRMLYFDARLSKDQERSCNSCHPLAKYGADGEPTSQGYKGQRGNRNSPSVYNAAAQFVQFWDGRAADVEAQAKGPMLNPVEMAMPSGDAVVRVLKSMPEYVAAFHDAFPGDKDPVTFDHAAEAIGAFERKLVTPSRWDRFLAGDEVAITPAEKEGFNVFVQEGCSGCHQGVLVGGNALQRLGAMKTYPDSSDPGRYNVTHNEGDRMYFKVPPLRNVAMTAPYFHNGKVASLNEAVAQMGEYQLGRTLTTQQIQSIVTWLNTLTGEIPAGYVQAPVLPKSTKATPRPATEG